MQTLNLKIKGMTCASCKEHINYVVNKLDGVTNVNSSYKNGHTEVQFDNSKVTIKEIKKAINSTGYSVIKSKNK